MVDQWRRIFGVNALKFDVAGHGAPGESVRFLGRLESVPIQSVPTHFPVDHLYPVAPGAGVEVVADCGGRVLGVHRRVGTSGSATFLGFRPRDDQSASLGTEVRTWFEILHALGAYPSSSEGLRMSDNPSVISRRDRLVSCRFPNGTVTLAAHLHRYVEAWPGGFHRNEKQDAEILSRHPLPPDRILLDRFRVAGHEISYDGRLVVAVRPGPGNVPLAFGGYDCRGVVLNGVETRFADRPLHFIAWAPVTPNRRVPGGAVAELWIQGAGMVRLPRPAEAVKPRLFHAGPRPGGVGGEVRVTAVGDGMSLEVQPGWGRAHLYVMV